MYIVNCTGDNVVIVEVSSFVLPNDRPLELMAASVWTLGIKLIAL